MTLARIAVVLFLLPAAAAAQQLYRWTDENGRVHITDTPPPSSAKDVRRVKPGAGGAAKPDPTVPFALQRAMKDYPVTLYTSPGCDAPCAQAREFLNQRGVPFKEVVVWEQETNEELQRESGKTEVPTVKVGSTVFTGFQRAAYDALLNSAGYPAAGVLPARKQAAPERPEGYTPSEEREPPKAQAVKPEPPAPRGPYAPR